jgi:hypothetical protein
MKEIATQGQFSARFILIETTMATTSVSNPIDATGLCLVGLELPALTGAAGTAQILEYPTFAGTSGVALEDNAGNTINITLGAANQVRMYRWSPLLFPATGKIALQLTTKTLAAGSTVGFLFIKPQGER